MILCSMIMTAFITPVIANHIGIVDVFNINITPILTFGILFAGSFVPLESGILGGFVAVNVSKPGTNAGLGGGLKDMIIFFDWDDVASIPARDSRGILITGNITFNPGANMNTIYATPGSIVNNSKSEGEPDQEGIIQSVKFAHPGSAQEIREFRANMLSRNIGIIHRKCSDPTNMDIYGTKCNPLRLSFDWTHDKDKNMTEFTLTSASRGEDVGIYTGNCTWNDESGSN